MSDREPSRPDFQPPPRWTEPGRMSTRRAPTYAPPASRRPLLITLAVIAVVLGIVVLATVAAQRSDREMAGAAPSAQQGPAQAPSRDPAGALGIDFVTPEGAGHLLVLGHRWSTDDEDRTVLLLDVQLSCASGVVDYDPFNFQTFDAAGDVYDVTPERADRSLLGVGDLRPGQAVQGQLPFVMPRGEVTLLMGDALRTVTALRIPD